MTGHMAELRFPLRGRQGGRPGEHTNPTPDPLVEMAAQIRALDQAAEAVAARINEAAASLANREHSGNSATRADLLAGLASALVDRTEAIRSDCGRLSTLMERTAKLVAERDADRTTDAEPRAATTAAHPVESEPATELEPTPPAEPEIDEAVQPPAASEPAPAPERPAPAATEKPRWLSRRNDREARSVGSTSEGVRLIATQMAIAGSSRAEIERRLRIQFGVRDADQALDEIFGGHHSEVG